MMPLSEIFFFGIVFYLVYKFLFNFLLPVFKSTKAFKEQFRNMRDNMQDQTGQTGPFQHSRSQQNTTQSNPFSAAPKKPEPSRPAGKAGEYIDFEEIK
jgi:hypothetical protein